MSVPITRTPTSRPPRGPVSDRTTAGWLALAATAGPVLFTAAWLVLGALSTGYTLFGTRIAPYSPVSQPISGLGLGGTAAWMNAAFVINGLMIIVGVIGLFRIASAGRPRLRLVAAVLLALTGVGSALDGIFTLESMLGHSIGFLLAVGVPVVSFPVAGVYLRGVPGWRRSGTCLLAAGPVTLVLVAAFFATFEPTAAGVRHGVAGLVQRVAVTEVLGWFAALGLLAWLDRRRGR